MIWCLGLPRSGGQSLLCLFSECQWEAWHSIEYDRWGVVSRHTRAIIECYAPVQWCIDNYRQPKHDSKPKFVMNIREDKKSWITSCEKMLVRATKHSWSHPLWRRPKSQWPDFYDEYYDQKYYDLDRLGCEYITIDVTQNRQQDLKNFVSFTGLQWPHKSWPNYDRFARFNARMTSTHCEAALDVRGGGPILGVTF